MASQPEALHPKTGNEHMRKRVSNYAFFRSYRTLVASSSSRSRRARCRPPPPWRRGRRRRPPRQEDTPGRALPDPTRLHFFVLFVLRTGIDVVDASPLFGLDDSSGPVTSRRTCAPP